MSAGPEERAETTALADLEVGLLFGTLEEEEEEEATTDRAGDSPATAS